MSAPKPMVRDTMLEDCRELARELRMEDRREIQAASDRPPLQVIQEGFARSDPCFTIIWQDRVVAIFGVAFLTDEVVNGRSQRVGAVWLLSTPDLERLRLSFLRQSKFWLKRLAHGYDRLTNVIDDRNVLHRRWLEWLGFTMVQLLPGYGTQGEPFWEFSVLTRDLRLSGQRN